MANGDWIKHAEWPRRLEFPYNNKLEKIPLKDLTFDDIVECVYTVNTFVVNNIRYYLDLGDCYEYVSEYKRILYNTDHGLVVVFYVMTEEDDIDTYRFFAIEIKNDEDGNKEWYWNRVCWELEDSDKEPSINEFIELYINKYNPGLKSCQVANIVDTISDDEFVSYTKIPPKLETVSAYQFKTDGMINGEKYKAGDYYIKSSKSKRIVPKKEFESKYQL